MGELSGESNPQPVIPAQAGIRLLYFRPTEELGPGLRRDDEN
jgi:hypothetical protein